MSLREAMYSMTLENAQYNEYKKWPSEAIT